MTLRRSPLAVLAAVLVAGCAAPLAPAATDDVAPAAAALVFGPATIAVDGCENPFRTCFEPSIAADPGGRMFLSNGLAGSLRTSVDGGATWQALDDPPMPVPASVALFQSDVLVQTSPGGRLYYSAVLFSWTSVLAGVQVASSGDGGRTWDTNSLLHAPTTEESVSIGADRQWLAFGEEGVVWVGYHQIPPATRAGAISPVLNDLRVARSSDGGATWSGWSAAVPPGDYIGGAPIVDASGRFLYPTFVAGEAALEVVATTDGVAFERLLVWEPAAGLAGGYFPSLVETPSGALVVVWQDDDRALRAARSADGGVSWTDPVVWSLPGEAVLVSPWAAPRADEGVDVLLFTEAADGARLAHVRADAAMAVVSRTDVAEVTRAQGSREAANTDFAHFVATDRGLATTWVQGPAEIRVALGR